MTFFSRLSFALCLLALFLSASSARCHAQVFTVSGPSALTVYPGQGPVTVAVTASSTTYAGPVNLTLSGLPSDITVSPSVLTLTPGSTGTFTLNVGLHADREAFPANSYYGPYSAVANVTLLGSAGSRIATAPLPLTIALSNPAFTPAPGAINLPIVNIDTAGVPIDSKTTDVAGTITITSPDGSTSYLPGTGSTDNTATFHVHGNSTAFMPKLAYHVKLNTSMDLMTQLGVSCPYVTSSGKPVCDKSKSYILLANYADKTMLRDWSAFALANAIPFGGSFLSETPVPAGDTGVIPTPSGSSALLPWAPHSVFVELFLNGIYEGTYQLTEQVKLDSHRVNIPELTETQTSGDLTGGYLLEIDQRRDEAYVFTTPRGLPIGLDDPDFSPDPEVPEQTSYITRYVDSAETALFSRNFTSPTQGWRSYFDEASAVNYYLVNDIMGNVDAGNFFSSVYLYKNADNPFLYMGPVWDFDISSGNVNYYPIENPTVPWMQTQAPWYAQWFQDPGFKADVIRQFNTLKDSGILSSWLASIPSKAATLEKAQANNFQRWPMLGIPVWPNPEVVGTYDGEVAYLTNYVNLRIAYLDALFNGKASTSTSLALAAAPLYQGAAVPLVAQVTGGSGLSGVVSFFSGQVLIGTAPLDQTATATLTTTNLLLGTNPLFAVFNGNTTSALSASAARTVTVIAPLTATAATLSTSATAVPPGGTVNLNISVFNSGRNSNKPSGTVTLLSNGKAIASTTLSAGLASLVPASLPAGTDTLQITYPGDATHQPASSNTVVVTVGAGSVPVTFTTIPAGLHLTVDGTAYSSPTTLSLAPGSVHSIATASPQSLSGTQETWVSWSDKGTQAHTVTVPSAAATFAATFSSAGSPVFAPAINFSGGFQPRAMALNGSPALNGTRLRLTNGRDFEAGSAFYPSRVKVSAFTSDFTFQLTNAFADGFMFVIQSQGANALGNAGGDLGYGVGVKSSVGLKFDLFNNNGEGANSTGLFLNGTTPSGASIDLTPTGLDLHSGDTFRVHLSYNGTTLVVTVTDTVTGKVATQTYPVNIASTVGNTTAFVGFTAGTGAEAATQDILTWTYTPN